MEKTYVISYQESSDARSIYRERTAAPFAFAETSAVFGNLAHAIRDAITIFVTSPDADKIAPEEKPNRAI